MEMVSSDGIYSYTDVKTAEMTTKGLDYNINKLTKQVWDNRLQFLKDVLLWVKCYQTALHATKKPFTEVNPHSKLHCCLILRNCHRHPSLQQPLPYQSAVTNTEARALHQQRR